MTLRRSYLAALIATVAGVLALAAGAAMAARHHTNRIRGAAARERTFHRVVRRDARGTVHTAVRSSSTTGHSADDGDLAAAQAQYGYERTAPGTTVSGQALVDAQQQADTLGETGGPWQEMTTKPYNAEPSNYTDPFWGNQGSGFSIVGGRTTALVASHDGSTWFAGTADGGVWKSTDHGGTWTPLTDALPSLSTGALAVAPDGSLWVGTGEANTSQDSYAGTGVYRSTDDGTTFSRVGDDSSGGNPIAGRTIFRIAFDPKGDAYAATDDGLFRYNAGTEAWTEVLAPAPAGDPAPYYDNQVTDVAVVPGSRGKDVIAVVGWRGPVTPDNRNGFYESTDGGQHFAKVKPLGDINGGDIGRTTFAYSSDGSKLYAVVESPTALANGAISVLQGVFVSTATPQHVASVAGPWSEIADARKLSRSGSANAYGPNSVGAQAWYNQDLAVDPRDPKHIYVGLEEVFESIDGGQNWVTASPYWNYGLACGSSCPNVTHPDQHAMMIAGGKIVIGNDGGVYDRPLSDTQQYGDWSDLNNTLRSWQYYDARAGALPGGGLGIWGGLQDNGTSLLQSGSTQMVEPAGGDGFDVVVDPADANNMVGEYTDGTMYSSTDGGHTFNSYVSPTCIAQETVGTTPRSDCDPNARFVTPLIQDQQKATTWVTGGEFVWVTRDGWNTSCTDTACSWTPVFDTGANHAVTALSSANDGGTIYAAWVSGAGEPSPSFQVGIATNFGGTWHQLDMTGLPNRYIAGVTVDPSNPAHAYAVFNGYSRRWIPGGGTGHVFETTDGGQSWTDISGNLPDIASDALVLSGGQLALATDQGVFGASVGGGPGTTWYRLGTDLPNASVNDLTVGPDGDVYAATHGRGIWRLPLP